MKLFKGKYTWADIGITALIIALLPVILLYDLLCVIKDCLENK